MGSLYEIDILKQIYVKNAINTSWTKVVIPRNQTKNILHIYLSLLDTKVNLHIDNVV